MIGEIDAIQILIQSGAIGLAGYLIYVGRQKDKEINHTIANHFKHDIEAKEKLTKALTKLTAAIDGWEKRRRK